jgi:hypothetical protein
LTSAIVPTILLIRLKPIEIIKNWGDFNDRISKFM